MTHKRNERLTYLHCSLDKGVDKPKDWQALFAIADEIETRKTNQQKPL